MVMISEALGRYADSVTKEVVSGSFEDLWTTSGILSLHCAELIISSVIVLLQVILCLSLFDPPRKASKRNRRPPSIPD